MFLVKKILDVLLAPGTLILALLALGLLRLGRAAAPRRPGLFWLSASLVCYYLFTTAPLPTLALRSLERQYAPLSPAALPAGVQYIVVLSAGVRSVAGVPATSIVDDCSAARVAEGVRLFRLLASEPQLVMSGGGWVRLADQMAAFAQALGVPAAKIITETDSLDTHGNAQGVRAIVQDAPFLLVTSASHLPRSMAIFHLLGMRPLPAPADFRAPTHFAWVDFFPSSLHLKNLELAWHEYLGLAYLWLLPRRAGR